MFRQAQEHKVLLVPPEVRSIRNRLSLGASRGTHPANTLILYFQPKPPGLRSFVWQPLWPPSFPDNAHFGPCLPSSRSRRGLCFWNFNIWDFLVGAGLPRESRQHDSPCTLSQWWRSCLGGLRGREMACIWHRQSPASGIWTAGEECLLRPWSWWTSYERRGRREERLWEPGELLFVLSGHLQTSILVLKAALSSLQSNACLKVSWVQEAMTTPSDHGGRKWPIIWCLNPKGAAGKHKMDI